jgi:thermostable 8-oxoguanine DNA glycosylase
MISPLDSLTHISELLGFTPPGNIAHMYVDLSARLNTFAGNRYQWLSEKPYENRVLKQHMAFTLLVPGGKASKARKAVELLTTCGYLDNPGGYAVADIAEMLRPCVRFHNVKTKRLHHMLVNWPALVIYVHTYLTLKSGINPVKLRGMISKYVPGFGKKATAHFMRNTGICSGANALPIIDVHIHKALEAFGFKHATYEEAEESFVGMAKLMCLNVHLLDAWLWCGYANNWDFGNADFDNFTTNKETKHERDTVTTGKDTSTDSSNAG